MFTCDFRVLWDVLQIYIQVHEIPGSLGTSFEFMLGSMSFRGPPGPPSNVCLGPLGFGVSLTLLPIYVRVHEVWGSF
jgi:hypothetical protein